MMILKSVTFTNETDPPTRAPPHPRSGIQVAAWKFLARDAHNEYGSVRVRATSAQHPPDYHRTPFFSRSCRAYLTGRTQCAGWGGPRRRNNGFIIGNEASHLCKRFLTQPSFLTERDGRILYCPSELGSSVPPAHQNYRFTVNPVRRVRCDTCTPRVRWMTCVCVTPHALRGERHKGWGMQSMSPGASPPHHQSPHRQDPADSAHSGVAPSAPTALTDDTARASQRLAAMSCATLHRKQAEEADSRPDEDEAAAAAASPGERIA